MFTSPNKIAFSILSLDVRWYGIIMAFAILCGLIVILAIRKKYYKDINEENIFDITLLLIIAGIIGARTYYVVIDWNYFQYHLTDIPCIWHGGISIHGAIITGIIAFLIYAKKKKLNFLRYADLLSFGLITGQIIGRWGNFFNSEAFGLPCDLPWKLFIPVESRPIGFENYQFFHPTFLYESLANIIILLIMLSTLRKKEEEKKVGEIFYIYLLAYSFVRLFIEDLRIDSVLTFYGTIHIAHIASYLLFFIGAISYWKLHSTKKE